MPVDVEEIGCDLLSVSAHKIYAPKGVGALYVRRGVRLHPQQVGGHQERERRGGTESVPLIVAFGKACEIAQSNLGTRRRRCVHFATALRTGSAKWCRTPSFNGDDEHRVPTVSNISFAGIEGEGLLINLDMQGIAVSTGSACSSGSVEPSPVIKALGQADDLARGAVRFSFGRFNTPRTSSILLDVLPGAVENLRRLSPGPCENRPPMNINLAFPLQPMNEVFLHIASDIEDGTHARCCRAPRSRRERRLSVSPAFPTRRSV